jgi:GNAT superfamily N-acetyltransferase
MSRSHITVRAAGASDVADLVVLWDELKRCGALNSRHASLPDDRTIEARVHRLLSRPSGRILLAFLGDEPVGMAMLTTVPLGALNEAACVQVEYTVVAEGFRRRGVGRALMGAAACYAEDIGAEQVTVSVSPMSREANRFYAQLGLAPLSVRRVAPASALRRRIATLDHGPAAHDHPTGRRPLSQLRRMAIASAVAEQPNDA